MSYCLIPSLESPSETGTILKRFCFLQVRLTSNACGLCKPNTSVNITKKIKEEISFHYLPKGPTAEGNHPDSYQCKTLDAKVKIQEVRYRKGSYMHKASKKSD